MSVEDVVLWLIKYKVTVFRPVVTYPSQWVLVRSVRHCRSRKSSSSPSPHLSETAVDNDWVRCDLQLSSREWRRSVRIVVLEGGSCASFSTK
ncbi:hypothetical protein GN956_G1757 [Arapaima gigas]